MKALIDSLWVAFGAAIGANMRFWIGVLTNASKQSFPWPTLLINILGSAMLGAFSAAALLKGWGGQNRLFFAVGLCGGFTTFSTFSYEVIDMYYQSSMKLAILYALLSGTLSVGACFVGAHWTRVSLSHGSPSQGNPFRP